MLTRNSYLATALLEGPAGLAAALLLYGLLTCLAPMVPPAPPSDAGLCLPSPPLWGLHGPAAMGVAAALTLLCAFLSIIISSRFTLVSGTGTLHASLFIVAQGCMPWTTTGLSGASLLCAGMLVCTWLLFGLYGLKNTSQGIFVIFTLLAWGSMVQYAFLLLMPLFMLGAVFLGVFTLRTFLAMLLGIAAPYWIVLGLGVVNVEDFAVPALTNIFSGYTDPGTLLYFMLQMALLALFSLLLTASNTMAAEGAGARHRSYNSFVNLLAVAMVWFMVFDYNNFTAYSSATAACLGLQAARFATSPRHKFPFLPVIIIVPVMLALFLLSIFRPSF